MFKFLQYVGRYNMSDVPTTIFFEFIEKILYPLFNYIVHLDGN
jgi:hypothetical protein